LQRKKNAAEMKIPPRFGMQSGKGAARSMLVGSFGYSA